MLRYLRSLADKDLALDRTMIPLGSCTMKLNATTEMIPVTWPEFSNIHPFAPDDADRRLPRNDRPARRRCCAPSPATPPISLQPNAGSQGEYAGLLVIQAYHQSRGEGHRNICLIPSSAHGTNPASANMVGMKVVVTACDENGNVDLADLKAKAEQHSKNLACVMVTYPSTHGVFEEGIQELCEDHPLARRPGLHRRRQHERAGRRGGAGQLRRRRQPPEPAQDLLHPARRRRTGRRPDRRRRAPGQVPAEPAFDRLHRATKRASARSAPRLTARPASCRSRGCTSR